MALSNSQITKLGDRLRQGITDEEDLNLLDEFRQTFSDLDQLAYPVIQGALMERTDCTLTKRKRKTQQSIVDKLIRQPRLRLPQMQDIAGCRIVVEGGSQAAQQINALLSDALSSSHSLLSSEWQVESKNREAKGYHAIHIVVKADKKFYEIQLRTYAQDIWANLVERMSDEKNTLKYGGSEQEQPLMSKLMRLADTFSDIDQSAHKMTFADYQQQLQEAIRDVLSD